MNDQGSRESQKNQKGTPLADAGAIDLLAFAAHPDDAELGCGGVLRLAARAGLRTAIADLTRGELATRGTVEERQEESARASRILGLSLRHNLGLPDGHLEGGVDERRKVVEAIRELRPRWVLAPDREDRHADHAVAGELVLRSLYLAGIGRFGRGEPHRPRGVLVYMMHRTFLPSLIVDVSEVIDEKRAAVEAYRSQLHREGAGEPPTFISRPEFLDEWVARHRYYGSLIEAAYGEAYLSPSPLPIDDISGLFGPAGRRP